MKTMVRTIKTGQPNQWGHCYKKKGAHGVCAYTHPILPNLISFHLISLSHFIYIIFIVDYTCSYYYIIILFLFGPPSLTPKATPQLLMIQEQLQWRKLNHGWIHLLHLLLIFCCNTDVASLSSGTAIKAVVIYVSDYITKTTLKMLMRRSFFHLRKHCQL